MKNYKNQFGAIAVANVSIPLRGIGYEKPQFCVDQIAAGDEFPSPCGELVMKNVLQMKLLMRLARSFHPLAGNWL